jgi:type II secretory pathway component PulF
MSSASASIISRPVTLEQLTALSDEIGALARAGVPLDRGLRELSCDMPGRLGRLAGEIGRRLEAGGSLSQVIGEMGSALPPAYRCVVEAGVRAGRLPMAMEGISQTARRIGQLRNSIYLSLLYPLMVLLVTWGLGVFVLMRIGPVLSRTLVDFDVAGPWIVDLYDAAARHSTWAGPLIPLVFGVWLAWAWYRCGRLAEGRELHPLLAFGAVGVLARLQRASRLSSLADLLSLLIANEVPLSEAVELASAAVGSAQLAQGGKKFAEQLRCGEVIDKAPAGFPPVLAWTLAGGQSQPRLVRTLSRAAEVYRDEVARRSQWLMIYVPLFATIGICGSLVCLYTLMTLGPWIALMRRISEPY